MIVASTEDVEQHTAQRPEEMLTLEDILGKLMAELLRRGRVGGAAEAERLLESTPEARYALATRLMNE